MMEIEGFRWFSSPAGNSVSPNPVTGEEHLFDIWYVIVFLAWGAFRSFALQIVNSFVVCSCNKLKTTKKIKSIYTIEL